MECDMQQMAATLLRLDGRGYPAFKDIRGEVKADTFTLLIDHVQGDPFAAPSRLRVRVPMDVAGFPPDTYENHVRRVALRDYLARGFSQASHAASANLGSGKSGLIAMDPPGQEILERSSIVVTDTLVEARFVLGLPARGRRVLGRQAVVMLCEKIPAIVRQSLLYASLPAEDLDAHLDTA